MFDLLKDTQTSPLAQYCAKPGKTVPGSGGQEQQANLQPPLNKEAGGSSLTFFVTDCGYFYKVMSTEQFLF